MDISFLRDARGTSTATCGSAGISSARENERRVVLPCVVKIDSDEVLLDIGYKSEGVIPSRELSIRNDVDPHDVVTLDVAQLCRACDIIEDVNRTHSRMLLSRTGINAKDACVRNC